MCFGKCAQRDGARCAQSPNRWKSRIPLFFKGELHGCSAQLNFAGAVAEAQKLEFINGKDVKELLEAGKYGKTPGTRSFDKKNGF